jgi:RNA polymerase sigma-70 factor, ECF subfamily
MAFKNLEDQDLVVLYKQGNEDAFATLLFRHKERIFRGIVSKVKDYELANDIFQDTFIKIINTIKLGNYNEEGKFLPWAIRISQNLVIDHFRRSARFRVINEKCGRNEDFNIFSVIKCEDDNIEEEITKQELLDQVVQLLDHLPESQREIVVQRIFEDLSFKEISDQENCSINTSLGRMRYALINLRRMITENELVVDL